MTTMPTPGNPLGLEFFGGNGFGAETLLTPGQLMQSGDMSSLRSGGFGALSPIDTGVPGLTPNGSAGGFFGGMSGIQKAGAVMGGLQSLSNMYLGFSALSQARKQFKAQRGFANANLENQVKSYNTALEDRARTRAAVEDQSSEQSQGYIDRNRLNYKKI